MPSFSKTRGKISAWPLLEATWRKDMLLFLSSRLSTGKSLVGGKSRRLFLIKYPASWISLLVYHVSKSQ
jgi:hypothetical protein